MSRRAARGRIDRLRAGIPDTSQDERLLEAMGTVLGASREQIREARRELGWPEGS